MSTVENPGSVPASTPAPSTPPAPAPPAPSAPAQPAAPPKAPDARNMRATIEHNFKQRGQHASAQPRTPQGQFSGPPAQAAPIPQQQPAVSRPAMPSSLKQDLKSHWEAAPPELLSDFIRRDEEYTKHARALSQTKAQFDELMSEFKPYEAMMTAENVTPRAAVAELMRVAAMLRGSPQQRLNAVASIMRQFQVPVDQVQQLLTQTPSSGPALPQQAPDPQVTQLVQQVQQLTALQQQQQDAQVNEAIRVFASDPAHAHFASVSDTMAALLQSPGILGPDVDSMGIRERLKAAYDKAVLLHPELTAAPLQAPATIPEEKTQAEVAQARAAAVQVSGAPASAPVQRVDTKNLRGLIAHNARNLGR